MNGKDTVMRVLRTTALLALCTVASGQTIVANRFVSPAPIINLLTKADAVVVGYFGAVSASVGQASVTLNIIRTIKGDLRQGDIVYVDWAVPEFSGTPRDETPSIWFLRHDETKWRPHPVMLSGSPSFWDYFLRVSAKDSAVDASGTPDERLVRELVNAVTQSGAATPAWLWMDQLIEDLPESPKMEELYSSLLNSSILDVKALGVAGLIRMGKTDGYAALAASESLRNQSSRANDLAANAVCRTPRNPEAIMALKSLTSSQSPRLAYCAAVALTSFRNKETVPYLVQLLEHPSADVRYAGVIGLAAFASNLGVPKSGNDLSWLTPRPGPAPYKPDDGQTHYPMRETFAKNEIEYLTFWKNWWAKHSVTLK